MRPMRRFPRPCCPHRRRFIPRPSSSCIEKLAPRRRGLRQCRAHRAAARGATAGRARRLYQRAPRQRRKAFRWRWMRLIDEHWIAYPEFIAGALERHRAAQAQAAAAGPSVRYLDVILSRGLGPAPRGSVARRLRAERLCWWCRAAAPATRARAMRWQQFAAAARALAARGVPTVFVGPASAATAAAAARRGRRTVGIRSARCRRRNWRSSCARRG